MIIADQITLFFKKIGETQANSRLTAEQALEYINDHRRSMSEETKFYDINDKITATGGETYITLRNDFTPPENVRDWAKRNGHAITVKAEADWATETNGSVINMLGSDESWGMLRGSTFFVYPALTAGEIIEWRGTGNPLPLPDITGPDIYLNDNQAELTVLDAAASALEDLGETPGPILLNRISKLRKIVEKRAKPRGARLENPPRE